MLNNYYIIIFIYIYSSNNINNNNENKKEKNGLDYKKEEKKEKKDENGLQKDKLDIYSLRVEDLKTELKKRNVNIPKNAKKKDLQELLLNLDK